MAILITGATGLVGNNVVRLLVERGDEVRVLVRRSGDPRPLAGLPLQRCEGDVRDAEAVRRACQGVKAVIHAAAFVHIGHSQAELHEAINVQGTCHVADAARSAGARLVHVSTRDTLGPGTRETPADEETPAGEEIPFPYARSKRRAEGELLRRVGEGLDAVIVNPTYLIGPWDWKPSSGRMLLAVAKRFIPVCPTGMNNFADARDVAAGVLAALERGQTGRQYILGGENLDYIDAWRLFAEVTGGSPPWWPLKPLGKWLYANVGDAWYKLTGREPDMNSAAIYSSSLIHTSTSARAERELGYRRRPFREAVEAAWAWFREHGYA